MYIHTFFAVMKRIYKMILMVYHRMELWSPASSTTITIIINFFVYKIFVKEIIFEISICTLYIVHAIFGMNLTVKNTTSNRSETMATGLINQLAFINVRQIHVIGWKRIEKKMSLDSSKLHTVH